MEPFRHGQRVKINHAYHDAHGVRRVFECGVREGVIVRRERVHMGDGRILDWRVSHGEHDVRGHMYATNELEPING